ncbi:response regulator transcription factor [Extibacter muris]|uniref:response regulator transcription factor n=1 Tax=Extibacter muris TaxID=1796622 RepID=UPI001D066608|nr:response regulator transcription factor [Extibacter muris]MCB6202677.1 response regulator transcription factor [Extibacter muris]MCQ4664527.1 response regulator transcription factor [Extibacter muris]MCQ4693736.1 response regulator transcription factor [Extibacter muris]
MRILIIEDDEGLSKGMAFMMERAGYQVECCPGYEQGLAKVLKAPPELILLDWNLPDGDGLELCRKIREFSHVPILMITARDMEMDEVMCLECGADDYIAKPFSLAVLKARVSALFRRYSKKLESGSLLISRDIRIDGAGMKAYKEDKALELSLTEFRLLKYLLENKNQVLLKEQILEQVWDMGGAFVEENTLTVNIGRLRRKLGVDSSGSEYIKTIHGIGYLWEERHD